MGLFSSKNKKQPAAQPQPQARPTNVPGAYPSQPHSQYRSPPRVPAPPPGSCVKRKPVPTRAPAQPVPPPPAKTKGSSWLGLKRMFSSSSPAPPQRRENPYGPRPPVAANPRPDPRKQKQKPMPPQQEKKQGWFGNSPTPAKAPAPKPLQTGRNDPRGTVLADFMRNPAELKSSTDVAVAPQVKPRQPLRKRWTNRRASVASTSSGLSFACRGIGPERPAYVQRPAKRPVQSPVATKREWCIRCRKAPAIQHHPLCRQCLMADMQDQYVQGPPAPLKHKKQQIGQNPLMYGSLERLERSVPPKMQHGRPTPPPKTPPRTPPKDPRVKAQRQIPKEVKAPPKAAQPIRQNVPSKTRWPFGGSSENVNNGSTSSRASHSTGGSGPMLQELTTKTETREEALRRKKRNEALRMLCVNEKQTSRGQPVFSKNLPSRFPSHHPTLVDPRAHRRSRDTDFYKFYDEILK